MLNNLTFITAHFNDFNWTELLIKKIYLTTPMDRISEIIIIDQDRTDLSRERLEKLGDKVKIIQYPRSERHFSWTRHDHAEVLNQAVLSAIGEFIIIFDSDAHPISSKYLNICENMLEKYDAILAQVPGEVGMAHPCFMLLRSRHRILNLKFDKGLFENCTDTGRLIGSQLIDAGENVFLCEDKPVFLNRWGSLYLDSIYHHGKGSFHGVSDELLRSQIRWESDFFKNIIFYANRYKISYFERIKFYVFKIVYYFKKKGFRAAR